MEHYPFYKICQNTAALLGMNEPLWRERVRVRGSDVIITPTLILPHQGGGKFFRELDAPQLCCGVLHCIPLTLSSPPTTGERIKVRGCNVMAIFVPLFT